MEEDIRYYFTARIAGKLFRIETFGKQAARTCKGYFEKGQPEIEISIWQEDIDRERAEEARFTPGIHSSDGYLEELAVHRKIAEEMLAYNTFLMHGAAVADGEGAYLFTAPSGTGKTTHIKKWLENLPGAYVVNGDKPLVEITAEGAIVHGTPWCGKEKLGCNGKAPLRAVVLQQRGEENRMEEITFGAALPTLLRQSYRPDDPEKMKKTLSLLAELGKRVRFFHFTCNNLKPDAFQVAYDALHRKNK